MSVGIQEHERHIFPRWRSFRSTAELGELSRPTIEVANDTTGLDLSLAKGIASWEGNRSLWHDLDLLGTVVVAGKLDSFSALVADIRRNPQVPKIIRELLEKADRSQSVPLHPPETGGIPDFAARQEIRGHRRNLATAPRDPIEWIELARAYTIAGVNHKAEKAIIAALQLAPHNRFVLRSAARFLIHVGKPEKAQGLLSRAPIIRHDPWILASEIAIADSLGKPTRFVKLAREKMVADIAPSELTELASALGSLEAENGNHRVARRFLRQALIDANENSVAQIRWLNRSHLGEAIDVSHAKPPLLHEANSWASYYEGEFEIARNEALSWLEDQPFASAPATLSSFIAADIFLDFESGKSIALASLKSNPDDPMLLNNLAVCLMELGELDAAATTLSRLKYEERGGKIDATHKATFGMFAFRNGNFEEGRKLYLDAIDKANNSGEKATAARATSHLVIEELIANTTNVEEAILRLKEFDGLDEFKERSRFFDRIRALMRAEQRGLLPLAEAGSIIGRRAI